MPQSPLDQLDLLVVDPSPHMTTLIAQMLRHLKVRRVDEVHDADQALAQLQSHRYGAIMINDSAMNAPYRFYRAVLLQ